MLQTALHLITKPFETFHTSTLPSFFCFFAFFLLSSPSFLLNFLIACLLFDPLYSLLLRCFPSHHLTSLHFSYITREFLLFEVPLLVYRSPVQNGYLPIYSRTITELDLSYICQSSQVKLLIITLRNSSTQYSAILFKNSMAFRYVMSVIMSSIDDRLNNIPIHHIPHHSIFFPSPTTFYTTLFYTTLQLTTPHYTTPHYTSPHHTIQQHTILHHTIQQHTTQHNTTQHYITPNEFHATHF